jgi:hypothetical protein
MMAGNQTTIPELRKQRAKLEGAGVLRKAKGPPPMTVEQLKLSLANSEQARNKALGAQGELRIELDAAKAERDRLGLAEYEARTKAEVANGAKLRAERDLLEVNKQLDFQRQQATDLASDVARLGGMLDMLREIGAIPKQEPDHNGMYSEAVVRYDGGPVDFARTMRNRAGRP